MMQVQKIFIAALALACVCGAAMGQTNCITAPSMQLNPSTMAGVWYGSVFSPTPTEPMSCTRLTFSSPNADTFIGVLQYSNVAGSNEMNVQDTLNISLANFSSTNGYNASTSMNSSIVYKVLLQDPSNYALVCGYHNASDPSSIFGVILTREQDYNPSSIEAAASLMFGLPQQSWTDVNQSGCVLPSTTTTPFPETSGPSGSDNTTRTVHEVCTVVCTIQ